MHRFQPISATRQTINAQLYEHERILADQDSVGLYDGKERSQAFDQGHLYLTTHRLVYIDKQDSYRNSRFLDLSTVKQTEYWVGFIRSSPKITLALFPEVETGSSLDQSNVEQAARGDAAPSSSSIPAAQTWSCHVCGYRNLTTSGNLCALCGVKRIINDNGAAPDRTSTSPSARTRLDASLVREAQSSPATSPVNGSTSDATSAGLNACSVCTFLNHPSMTRCEICGSPLVSLQPTRLQTRSSVSASNSRPGTPSLPGTSTPTFVRLSFRDGGIQTFYATLKKALQAKEWLAASGERARRNRSGVNGSSQSAPGDAQVASMERHTATVGIDGILRTIDLDARDRDEDMQEALSDLELLMARAKEMVNLAQTLNAKIDSTSSDNGDNVDSEARKVVTRSLASLGLAAPAVTPELARDEAEYHRNLALELTSVLQGVRASASQHKPPQALMVDGRSARGMLPLDEVWCLWNRARGVALVSPKDLRAACSYLASVSRPTIAVRTFKSGLTVLHMPYYSEEAFAQRLRSSLLASTALTDGMAGMEEVGGYSSMEIARSEGLSITLAQQMLEELEDREPAMLVRDDGDLRQGTRWQLNYFEMFEKQASSPQ